MRSYSVMVITKDSESFDPGSSPGRTSRNFLLGKVEKVVGVRSADAYFGCIAQR